MTTYLIHWLFAALGLMLTAWMVPGITVKNIVAALIAAAVLGFLNVIVWPILAILTLPLTLITFGLFLFVLNAIILKFGAALVPGFSIDGFMPAFVGAIVLTIVGWATRYLLAGPV